MATVRHTFSVKNLKKLGFPSEVATNLHAFMQQEFKILFRMPITKFSEHWERKFSKIIEAQDLVQYLCINYVLSKTSDTK